MFQLSLECISAIYDLAQRQELVSELKLMLKAQWMQDFSKNMKILPSSH